MLAFFGHLSTMQELQRARRIELTTMLKHMCAKLEAEACFADLCPYRTFPYLNLNAAF